MRRALGLALSSYLLACQMADCWRFVYPLEERSLKPVNIGLCGLGTVGGGTLTVLKRNLLDINAHAGKSVVLTHIGARRDNPAFDLSGIKVSRDVFAVADDPEVDILVELIGGKIGRAHV